MINETNLKNELETLSQYKFGVATTNLNDHEIEILIECCEYQLRGRKDAKERIAKINTYLGK